MRIAGRCGLRQLVPAMTKRPIPPQTPPAAVPPVARPGRPGAGAAPAGSPGVDRVLALLEALAEADGATLSDLARRQGLAPSTTHRLLSALAARRLAEVDPATQAWSVGPVAFRLGAAFLRRGGLIERARPILDGLAAASGETAMLVMADGDAAMVVAEAPSSASLRVVLPPGTRLPYHATAAGKALIAHLPLAQVRALLGRDALPALTTRTLTDQGEVTADLATLRHGGYLSERGEAAEGQNAVAAPAFGGMGDPVAALAVAGPAHRLDDRAIDQMGPQVAAAARALGAALGGPTG